MMAHTAGDKKAALRDQHRPYDLSVDHQDISERILRQLIGGTLASLGITLPSQAQDREADAGSFGVM